MAVAAARPVPLPTALPAAPPAIAPITAPAPLVRLPLYTVSLPHTCRGVPTCCTIGVADSTRPCSCAPALPAMMGAGGRGMMATAEKMRVFFIGKLLSGGYSTHQAVEKLRPANAVPALASVPVISGPGSRQARDG